MTIKERPILFSALMVQAILSGTKTQTRRIVKRQYDMEFDAKDPLFGPYWLPYATLADGEDAKVPCPYGKPGDHLWVRETWQVVEGYQETESWEMPHIQWFEITGWPTTIPKSLPNECSLRYAADGWAEDERDDMDRPYPWRPSIYMPRWASRITLKITSIKVERLQAISKRDAIAEGIKRSQRAISPSESAECFWDYLRDEPNYRHPVDSYSSLWESIHGPGSWDVNPWVWVIEFEEVRP